MAKYYLRIEGVNLNNFIYETQDLSTIRGGSLLLLQAAKDVKSNVGGLTDISTGASIGLFSFEAKDDEEAKTKRDAVDKFLVDEFLHDSNYRHATFVVDVVQESGDASFPRDREAILALNRWRQMTAPQVAVPTYNEASVVVCDLDGVRPATGKKEFKGKPHNVSESVWARREHGRANKQEFVKKELDHINKGGVVQKKFAWTFDQIARSDSKGNLNHKMAVIYFDGNGFGKIQSSLKKATDLNEFDKALKTYRREWLAGLVDGMNSKDGWLVSAEDETTANLDERLHYRLELLLWGGDEACLVVPAWKGWSTLTNFFAKSKDWKTPADPGEELKHAAGIVFCHHNAPIRRIKDLAKALCEHTKREGGRDENYYLYEILESFDHIGKSLDSHLITRCPLQQDASRKTVADSLILRGEQMGNVSVAIMQKLKEALPRRKLVKLAQSLLNVSALPEEKDKQEIDKTMRDLLKACNGLSPADINALKNLINAFGGNADKWLALFQRPDVADLAQKCDEANPVWWIHVNALWDYIV